MKLTKKDLIDGIAYRAKIPASKARIFLDAMLGLMRDGLSKGDQINLFPIGSLKIVDCKSRMGMNPATGKKNIIPAKKRIKFRTSKSMKKLLAGKVSK